MFKDGAEYTTIDMVKTNALRDMKKDREMHLHNSSGN